MKKIIIACTALLIGMSSFFIFIKPTQASLSAHAQKTNPISLTQDDENKIIHDRWLKIPFPVHSPNVIQNGKSGTDNTLYLDVDSIEPIKKESFKAIINNKIKLNKPVIFAIVTTKKINGVYIYNIYEGSISTHFYGDNLQINRYTKPIRRSITNPTNDQPIINEVMFYMLTNTNQPVEILGSDYDLFYGERDLIKLLRFTLLANDTSNGNNLILGKIYHTQGKLELAKQYYKQAAQKGNYVALANLGGIYYKQNKLNKAKKYYSLALAKIKTFQKTTQLNDLAKEIKEKIKNVNDKLNATQ